MNSDWGELQITSEEIENLIDLNPITTLALDAYRAFTFKKPKQILSVLLTEVFAFSLLLMFTMSISFITLRNSEKLQDAASFIRLLAGISVLSLVGVWLGNIYIWKQAKKIKSLARLLDEIDKYNNVVQAIILIEKLEVADRSNPPSHQPEITQDVVEVMQGIRESLISALRVARIIKNHKSLLNTRYQLLDSLENNLNTLVSLDMSDQASEYSRLLKESLQIGMSVHQEVRKLKNQNF